MFPGAKSCVQLAAPLLLFAALAGCSPASPQPSSAPQAVLPVWSAPAAEPELSAPSEATKTPTTQPRPVFSPTAPPTPRATATATQAVPTPRPSPSPTSSPTSTPTSAPVPTAPRPLRERRIIAVDAGHGGREPGAVHTREDGRIDLLEKDVNLSIALRLASLLEKEGYRPVLTRQSDRAVNEPARDRNGDGRIDGDDDLQARVDVANEGGAELLLSIHNNGGSSPSARGTSTWYCSERPFGGQNRRLAELVQSALVRHLRAEGYADVLDLGARDDPPLQKPFGHLFLVGPRTPRVATPSAMPGVVGEALYVTNDREAKLLANESVLSRLAQAYLEAVVIFFAKE